MSMHSVITRAGSKILLVFLILILLNCATEKNYKVLSFFFDGVPKPGSGEKGEKTDKGGTQHQNETGQGQKTVTMVSRHPDYTGGNCDKCHDRSSRNFLKTRREIICFTCHDRNEFLGKYVHGPVAVNDCMFCHLPHESQYDSLLIKKDRDLCLDCHLEKDIFRNPAHQIEISTESQSTQSTKPPDQCIECHYVHAAGNHYFLKEGIIEMESKE